MNDHGEFLIPLVERGHSGSVTQNFLYRWNNVYVMDNHRAAAWCWMREMLPEETLNVFHIDEHYDTLYSNMEHWLPRCESIESLSLPEYLDLHWDAGGQSIPVFQWDTYLSIFLEKFKDRVDQCIFATQGVGDTPRWDEMLRPEAKQLPSNLPHWVGRDGRWIFNVDLDYFFCAFSNDRRELMFSPAYVRNVFEGIKEAWSSNRVCCITVCLSPDEGYSGSWENAEELLKLFAEVFEMPYPLAKDRSAL